MLYDALTKSLKTAQQQDVAHRINEIGVETDQEAQTAMAGIGTATNKKMADMLEAHEDHMVFARDVLEAKAKADERFARRFARSSRSTTRTFMGPDAAAIAQNAIQVLATAAYALICAVLVGRWTWHWDLSQRFSCGKYGGSGRPGEPGLLGKVAAKRRAMICTRDSRGSTKAASMTAAAEADSGGG